MIQDPPQWKILIDNTVIDENVTDTVTNRSTAPSRVAVENMRATLEAAIANANIMAGNGLDLNTTTDPDTLSVDLATDADDANISGLSFTTDGQLQADPAMVLRGLSTSDTTEFASPSGGIIQVNSGRDIATSVASNSVLISSEAAQPWDGGNTYLEGSIVSAGVGDFRQLFISLRAQNAQGSGVIPETTNPLSATQPTDGNWNEFTDPAKQDVLTTDQLAVINANPFTTTEQTRLANGNITLLVDATDPVFTDRLSLIHI